MKELNRPYKPDQATVDFLYEAYLLCRKAPAGVDKWARKGAFESFASCSDSWRVIGVSEDALREICATGTSEGLQRGHWFARDDRYEQLFGRDSVLMDKESLIDFFFEHDTTVIIKKKQNSSRSNYTEWGRIFEVPQGYFPIKGYGFAVRKEFEFSWAKKTIAELDSASKVELLQEVA